MTTRHRWSKPPGHDWLHGRRDELLRLIEPGIDGEQAEQLLDATASLVMIFAENPYHIDQDEVTPSNAGAAIDRLQAAIAELQQSWQDMGERARQLIGSAAVERSQNVLCDAPDLAAEDPRSLPGSDKFAVMFAWSRDRAADDLELIIEMLAELAAAGRAGSTELTTNAEAATRLQVGFLSALLRKLPISQPPPFNTETSWGPYCKVALEVLRAERGLSRLTEERLKNLKPKASPYELFDGDGHGDGLGIRVSPEGKLTWFMLYRDKTDQQHRELLLGQYPFLTLANARIAHAQKLKKLKADGETNAPRNAATASPPNFRKNYFRAITEAFG